MLDELKMLMTSNIFFFLFFF